jgi:hypothetical protein
LRDITAEPPDNRELGIWRTIRTIKLIICPFPGG